MRITMTFLLTFCFFFGMSQGQEKLIEAFKRKDIDSVISNCLLPFDLRVGSNEDDENISNKNSLRKKLRILFKDNYFDAILQWKKVKQSKLRISFEKRTFDKNGELESESIFTFYFKKGRNNTFKLYSIVLAG
jgi:hypothetical protein